MSRWQSPTLHLLLPPHPGVLAINKINSQLEFFFPSKFSVSKISHLAFLCSIVEASGVFYCLTAEEDTESHHSGGISGGHVAVRTSGRTHPTLLRPPPLQWITLGCVQSATAI